MLEANDLKGSFVALVTPFNKDGTVNFEKIKELVEFHLNNGTDGIVALGTTAETPTLTDEEKFKIAKIIIDTVNKKIPVIIGSGTNSTEHSIYLSKKYEKLGADGLLLVSPYYNKGNKEGLFNHFISIINSVNIPSILYNVPGRTGVNIPYEIVERLSKNKKIIGIKEASGNISYVAKCAKLIDDNFKILSGNDDMIVPVLSLGGTGVISVWANVEPKLCHNLVIDYLNGNIEKPKTIQLERLDFINNLFCETNPIPVKYAMNLLGFNVGEYRLPLYPLTEEDKLMVKKEMVKIKLIKE